MLVEEIIKKIRFRTGDTSETRYSDYDVMDKLNEANRFFRKVCYEEAPDLLAISARRKLEQGENIVHLCASPIKVIDVFCNGRHLDPSNNKDAARFGVGVPRVYTVNTRCALPTLNMYPVPGQCVDYRVEYIPETVELKKEDEIELPLDCVYYYVDYVVTRLTGSDPATFQEKQDELRSLLRNFTPSPCVVDSYY